MGGNVQKPRSGLFQGLAGAISPVSQVRAWAATCRSRDRACFRASQALFRPFHKSAHGRQRAEAAIGPVSGPRRRYFARFTSPRMGGNVQKPRSGLFQGLTGAISPVSQVRAWAATCRSRDRACFRASQALFRPFHKSAHGRQRAEAAIGPVSGPHRRYFARFTSPRAFFSSLSPRFPP